MAVNEVKTSGWMDVVQEIDRDKSGKEIRITVDRDGKKQKRMMVSIACRQSHNVFTCGRYGVTATWNLNKLMLKSLKMLFTGQMSRNDLAGPVGMVSLVNQTASAGAVPYLYLAALICLNLAYINLLPFPALDGGRIIFVMIRKITGNMISDDMEGKVHLAGMFLLITFAVFITWNDIMRLFG